MRFFVIQKNDFKYDVLLGLDSIKEFRLCQDHNLNIFQAGYNKNNQHIEDIKVKGSEKEIYVNWNEYMPIEQFDAQTDHLSKENKKMIYDLVDKYDTLFAKNRYDVGTFKEHEAHIKLSGNKYIAKKPYKCSYEDQKEIESQVSELLKVGLVEESCSPFAAPVTMAFRKAENKKNRMCIDFRELNKLIIPQTYPFPLIDDIIVRTNGCKWFTALDINSAFWSIPVRTKDRHKTAFITQHGHWQWTCMPFGLKIASATYQRIMSGIIKRNNLEQFCISYIDDILIYSKTMKEHLEHLEKVFQAIKSEGFRIKFVKCIFATHEIKYLGHVIGNDTVRPLNANLISIKNFPIPTSRKNIRQFLGKVNFYYKYIRFSKNIGAFPQSAKERCKLYLVQRM